MSSTVLDPVRTEPASIPLDLPPISDVLYPDIDFPIPALAPVPDSVSTASPDTADAVAPAFTIDSLSKADWAVARVLEAEARIARRAALASELHARIDAWLTKASASDNDSISCLTMLLRPYVESELATQRRSRSLVLPSGTAQLRKLPDRLDITNPEAAMSWASEHRPEAIVIRKELSKSVLKSVIFKEGDAVPGVSAELGPDELYVRANA
jgi:hypothetical protein